MLSLVVRVASLGRIPRPLSTTSSCRGLLLKESIVNQKGRILKTFKGWYIEEGASGALTRGGRGAVDPFKGVDAAIRTHNGHKGRQKQCLPRSDEGNQRHFRVFIEHQVPID